VKKLLLFLFVSLSAFCQESYVVKFVDAPLELDGKLNEDRWKNCGVMPEFWQNFPTDTLKANYQTEIYLTYDNENVYIGARMFSQGNKYIVPTLRRDFRAGGNDNISFVFDTFRDNTNAFLFGTNPLGVQREALLFNGATASGFFNAFWDNKWQCESFIGDGFWSCEAIIPLSTLRFKNDSQEWFFKSYRFDTQANENTVLVPVPQNQIIMSLGFEMPITFEKPLISPGKNISIIPYITGSAFRDFEKGIPTKSSFNIGGDAKIAVSSGLSLDLTVNPDFSTVEVDRQVINLTRFDITFPEQRQFFLENSDLFTGFGSYNLNPYVPPNAGLSSGNDQIFTPFFSRRVGIAFDSTTGTTVQNPILYGARLSGKIDDNWRVGLLNIMTAPDDEKEINAVNYSVGTIQRRVLKRSNIAGIFVNNQVINPEAGQSAFNRVGGLEYNHQSLDNHWTGKAYYHQSFSDDRQKGSNTHGVTVNYISRKFTAKWQHDFMGAGFEAVSGFVPRNDFFHINPTAGINLYPKKGGINRLSFGVAWDQYFKPEIGMTDLQAGPFVSLAFINSANILFQINRNYTYLFSDFDALRSNRELPILRQGNGYTYHNISGTFVTDRRKRLTMALQPLFGQYFNGSIVSLNTSLNYRMQPYALATLNVTYNKINLKEGENTVFVVGPRMEVTFSRSLFWTTFVQYNTQFDNLNINSRFQWRFAPVSDFFLVYSDNYDTGLGGVKNRAIVAKLTYWLNL
jgi:hypothetical protein